MGTGKQKITVGIESAIEGGSATLFHNGAEIDGMVGESGISRAEDILPNIDLLLRRNCLEREDIGTIVVATGPGSFTGIKIGIATALGMGDGLDRPVVGITSLHAMTYAVETDRQVISAVPIGRNFVAAQRFEKIAGKASPIAVPELFTETQFLHTLKNTPGIAVLYSGLIDRLSSIDEVVNPGTVVGAGPNIASLSVRGHLSGAATRDIVPLFIDRKPPAVVG